MIIDWICSDQAANFGRFLTGWSMFGIAIIFFVSKTK